MNTLSSYVVLICCLLFLPIAIASDNMKLSIGQWTFDDIRAENLVFDVVFTSQGFVLNIFADSIQFAQPIGRVNNLKLHCDQLLLQAEQFSCTSGKIAFQQSGLGQQRLQFKLTAEPDNKYYQLSIKGLSIASAQLAVDASFDNNNWQANINSPRIDLTSLISFVSPYLQAEHTKVLAGWNVEGDLKLSMKVSGQAENLNKLNIDLTAKALNLSNEQGNYVTENVATSLSLDLSHHKQQWQWQTKLNITDGQAYGEPVFVDFNTDPMLIQAQGVWQQNTGKLQVEHASIDHGTIVNAKGSFTGSIDKIEQLKFNIGQADMAGLYKIWLQPYLFGTAADSLELAGKVSLSYQQQADDYHLSLGLDKVFIDDEAGRFGFDELSGTVGWTNYDHPVESDLQWQGGHIYAISLGASQIKAQAKSSSLVLTESWQLPILDGELQVNEFSLQRPGDKHSTWTFDGLLTPISMEALSSALDWPVLHGKLSGVIPKVSYDNQQIQVNGALMVKLFEGTTVIRDLRLTEPFGALPQLYANIDMVGLDLEVLTKTFDFGKITGKLDGTMKNMRLSNWQPVQFDAHFATPKGDKSRRRISQKAVDKLSQIGGGAGGLLSRSFLRFFEDFSYQRLGLSCKLHNEVCEMSGVGEAERGYYIVKGGGLPPRINVVGYTRRVDWPDLIERLKAVSQSSGPVVQ